MENNQPLHVHDLPQLYSRPSHASLLQTLSLLALQPISFSPRSSNQPPPPTTTVNQAGIPHYLTTIISSSLSWLTEPQREEIWDLTSARLAERSGRTAMPSMTRTFRITDEVDVELYEPSLTEDRLGLKTWTSSALLARRLVVLRDLVGVDGGGGCGRVLELGAGTGLVGIAVARIWGVDVLLTDLPEIVGNLTRNVEANQGLGQSGSGRMNVRALDWSDETDVPGCEEKRFGVVIAADPIYSAEHPGMLVNTVKRWIRKGDSARFIVELPLRHGYERERKDLRDRLAAAGLVLIEEGREVGYDDWQGADGNPAEVECWWSVWKPNTIITTTNSKDSLSELQNHDIH